MDHLPPNLEVELKFELTAADARKFVRAPEIKALQTTKTRSKPLMATYYDTPDQALANKGVALRVRKEGRAFVQCLKADAPGKSTTGFARHEWEWRVLSQELDLDDLMKEKEVKAHLKGIDLKSLGPIYSTDIRRQSRELTMPGGSKILCELDQGKVMAAGRETQLYELELELVSGSDRELLELARIITTIVPGRLSSRTKAYRGHVLFEGKGAPWVTACHPPLPKTVSAEHVLHTAMQEGLKHLIANEDCVLERSHIEGVHQMRVASRRMRSVLTTYKKILPKGSFEDLSAQIKAVGNALGPARDWDVFLDEVLGDVQRGFDNDPALALMETMARAKQDEAYAQAHQMITGTAYAQTLTNSLHWLATSGWLDNGKVPQKLAAPATDTAKAILAKRHAQLLKTGKGIETLSIEQRHILRIAIKKARYASSFFAELYAKKSTKKYLKALKGLQESLGHLNDLATAERLMDELAQGLTGDELVQVKRASGLVDGWYMHAQSLREDELITAWNAFVKIKPFW